MKEELTVLLRELGAKLGVTGEHLWGTMVRQAMIEGVFRLVWLLACSFGVLLCLAGWYRMHRNYNAWASETDRCRDFDDYMAKKSSTGWFGLFALVVASLTTLLIWGFSIERAASIPAALLNPEYWALKEILGGL